MENAAPLAASEPPPQTITPWERQIMTPTPTLPLSGGGSESAVPCLDIDLSPHSPSQSRSGFASAEPGAGRDDAAAAPAHPIAPGSVAAPSLDPLPRKERHAP
jgi:hypothetical protein